MFKLRSIISLLLVLFLSGCAVMFKGSSQEVTVRSHDLKAKIFVKGAYKGEGDIVTTFRKKRITT